MISQANCTPATPMGANAPLRARDFPAPARPSVSGPRAPPRSISTVSSTARAAPGRRPTSCSPRTPTATGRDSSPMPPKATPTAFTSSAPDRAATKRDPYARELANDPAAPFPVCPAMIRSANAYPWHDAGFRTPDFADMVVYQLHIGTYAPSAPGVGLDLSRCGREDPVSRGPRRQRSPAAPRQRGWRTRPRWAIRGWATRAPTCTRRSSTTRSTTRPRCAAISPPSTALLAAKGFAPMTLADITPGGGADEGDGGPAARLRHRGRASTSFTTTRADGADV